MKRSNLITLLALVNMFASFSSASLLFQEDFEVTSLDTAKWTNNGGMLATSPVAQGSKAIGVDAAGEYFVTWSYGATTSVIGAPTELWIEYYQYVGEDTGNEYNGVAPKGPNGEIAIDLRTKGSGAGTGTYNLLTLDGRSGYFATVESGLPINTWEKILFGLKMTDTTRGNGIYSIYREVGGQWNPLVQEAPYRAFSDFSAYPYFLKVQFGTNNTDLFYDNIKIYDSNPIPEPCSLLVLGAGCAISAFRKRRNV